MMRVFCSKSARRAPLRGAWALVCLTLYVCNIYPLFGAGDSESPGQLTVEALFDFEVPIDVISGGVSSGVSAVVGDFPSDSIEDTMEGIFERNGWSAGWEGLSEADWGASTNGMVRFGLSNGPSIMVDSAFLAGIDESFFRAAVAPPSVSTNSVDISSLPVGDFDLLSRIWSYLDDDAPPSSPAGMPATPLVEDALFGDFWVSTLTVQALAHFDGGALDDWILSIPDGSLLSWLPETWGRTLNQVAAFVRDHPSGVRPYVRLVAVILYWIALYRYFIKRLVFTIETCFHGAG